MKRAKKRASRRKVAVVAPKEMTIAVHIPTTWTLGRIGEFLATLARENVRVTGRLPLK